MRRKRRLYGVLLGLFGVLAGAPMSFGAGFALFEGSARGNAMGGAMVGRADDPSALFYNPAGITQLPGVQVMGGATAIVPSTKVTIHPNQVPNVAAQTVSTKDNIWVPPHLYATYQFSDKLWFGLATFSPFGLGTEFNSNWEGRYDNYKAIIQSLTINPNIAFKVNDQLSLAAGLEVMWFELEWDRKLDPTGNPVTGRPNLRNPTLDVDQALKGDSLGYGFNLGLHYKPFSWMALGASYRSQVKQHLKGDAKFGSHPGGFFQNTDVSSSVTLPDMLFFGATFYPVQKLSVEVGGIWGRWSNLKDLNVTYETAISPLTPRTISLPKNWHDTWRFHIGAEYKTTDWLDLRAAYVYDEEPVDDAHADYFLPANNRHVVTFGPGFHWNNWALDFSYGYLLIEERHFKATDDQLNEGILDSDFKEGHAHLIGASLSYKF